MRKLIHKIKWQTISVGGWYIHGSQIRKAQCYRALCCNAEVKPFRIAHKRRRVLPKYWGNGSINWKNVTCKRCLKRK